MMAAWVNFAATGDPNGPACRTGAPYDREPRQLSRLRRQTSPKAAGWRTEPLEFIERFYAARA